MARPDTETLRDTLRDRLIDDWEQYGGIPVEAAYEGVDAPGVGPVGRSPVFNAPDRLPDDLPIPRGVPWLFRRLNTAYRAWHGVARGERDHHRRLETRRAFDSTHFSPFADAYAVTVLADEQERAGDDRWAAVAQDYLRDALSSAHTTTPDGDVRGTMTVFPYARGYKDDHVDRDEMDAWLGGNDVLYSQDTLALTMQALDATKDAADGFRDTWAREVLAQDHDALWDACRTGADAFDRTHTLTRLEDIDDGAVHTYANELVREDGPPNDVDPAVNAFLHDAGYEENGDFLRRVVAEERFDEEHHFYANPLHALGRLRLTLDDPSLDDRFLDVSDRMLSRHPDVDGINPMDSAALLQARVGSGRFAATERTLLDTVADYVDSGERAAYELYRAKVPVMTYFGGEPLTDAYLLETLQFLEEQGVW